MSESPKHERKVVTKYDPPPIPIRDCDWSAAREDYDLGDCIGHGPTPDAAIADLIMEEGLNK